MTKSDEDLLRKHRDLILAASGDGVYGLDCEGRATFANPAALHLTGYSSEEMIGKGSHDLIHHSHPDGSKFPKVDCPIYAAFKDGKVHRVSDEVFWRKDGSSFPVEYVSTPMFDDGVLVGAVVSFRDITEAKRAEEALRDSEKRYRKIFNATHDAMFLISADDGRVLDANEEACRMLGYSHDVLTTLTGVDLHPHELPKLEKMFAELRRAGKIKSDRLSCRASDGELIPALMSATITEVDGRDCILLLAQDMRKDIKAARRARKLQADLHHVSRFSSMGEMASGLAHELNQPLTAVTNYVQASRRILQSGSVEQRKNISLYLEKAAAQADRAAKIIPGLRRFIEKNEADRSLEDVNGLVEEASRLVLPGGSTQDIELVFDLSAGLPPVVVDKIQVQQVVFNLVRNAVEALGNTNDGQLTITTSGEAGGSILITVRDNGPGVDDDLLSRLFGAFVTTKNDGMGVGLSICRTIIEDHGGQITAEQNAGGGMTFQFTLPLAPNEDGKDDQ